MKKIKSFFNWLWAEKVLLVILLFAFILKIPALFEPLWYGDEAIYMVAGQAIKKGFTLYNDIFDHKPPLIYFLTAVSKNIHVFRAYLVGFHLVFLVSLYRLSQKFFSKTINQVLPLLLFIPLSIFWEGNIANAEMFFITFNTLAITWLYSKKRTPSKLEFFLGGLVFGFGFMFKSPSAATMGAFMIWYFFFNKDKFYKQFFNPKFWLLVLGFVLPITLSGAYYAYKGAFMPFLQAVLARNIGYLGSWEAQDHSLTSWYQSGLIWRSIVLMIASLVLFIAKKKAQLKSLSAFLILWFLFDFYAALLSERPYPHYLIQTAVPLVLLTTNLLKDSDWLNRIFTSLSLAIGTVAYFVIGFWNYPVLKNYTGFLKWTLGKIDKTSYHNLLDSRVSQTQKIAKYIKLNTKPSEKIFIWGTEPALYAVANRLPVGRFMTSFHIGDLHVKPEVFTDIVDYQPQYIILMDYETRNFSQLEGYLANHYIKVKTIDHGQIYRRIDK